MTIDLDYIRWMAQQTADVVTNVAPMVATVLRVDTDKILAFVEYVKAATDAVLDTVELFLKFPTVFGASGDGLTDVNGNCCPDCPCPSELQSVIWAMKSQIA